MRMWSELIFGRKRLILTAAFCLVAICGLGLPKLTFNSDTRAFFDSSDPKMAKLLSFERVFQPTRKVLYAIHSETKLENSPSFRAAIDWLSTEALSLPDATRVDSLSTASYAYSEEDEIHVNPYLEYICPKSCLGERLVALSEPMVLRRLISEDRQTAGIMGVFSIERNSTEKLANIAKSANELKRSFQAKYPDLGIHLTGGIPVSQAYVAAGRKDISTLFLAAALCLLILLRAILGDIRSTLLMMFTAICAVIVCMGIGGWIGMELNSASSTIPVMVLTLVVASTMHLFSHYLRLSQTGVDPLRAVSIAVNANYVPIILTTLTSAASLASLSFISSPPVRDLGILAAIGIFTGGIFAITITPILLESRKRSAKSAITASLQRALNKYAKLIENDRKFQLAPTILLITVAIGLSQLVIDDDFVAYLSDRTEVRQDTDFALEHLAGPSHIELEITAIDSVFSPKFLTELEELTSQLRSLPDVASVSSLSDVMQNVIRAFGEYGGIDSLSSDALSQFFLVYELSLRAGDSASDIVTQDRTQTHIPLLLNSTKASDVRKIETKINAWLTSYEHLDGVVTGENSPVAYLSSSNIPAVARTVIVSLTLTAIILGLFFRNWRFGVNALIAITLPILCGLGAWGWISGTIGLSGTIIIAVALGVVIDDAIHLLYQQRSALDRGDSALGSASYSIHRVGVPIVATTLLFLLGLSPLLFSDFQVNVTFAAVTSLILAISLIFDLAVLPRLMVWAARIENSGQVQDG